MENNLMGIYEIVNTSNNKRYVGRTTNLTKRKNSHYNALRKGEHYNKFLQRSFNKYGEDAFAFNVLEHCPSLEDTIERERYYIELLGTEYNDRGYNMAYAYTQYKRYDSNKQVNKSERYETWSNNISEKIKQHYIDNPERRLEISERFLTVDKETIYNIKQTLHDDLYLSIDKVAEMFNVSKNIVYHLSCLNSSQDINSKVNIIISNREEIKNKRMNRIIIRMFREGKDYNVIGESFGVDRVTIHRRLKTNATQHDKRMRDNAISRLRTRKYSKVRTLFVMTNGSYKETMRILNVSRNIVFNSLKYMNELEHVA